MATSARSLASQLALLFADHEGRTVGVVEAGHFEHPLFGGRPPVEGPLVEGENAVEDHEVDTLVVEAVPLGAEELRPVLAEIEIVVVLAHHHVGLVVELGEHLGAVVQLGFCAELGEIAAEHHEVRFGLQQICFGDRTDQTAVPVVDESAALDVLDM